MMYYETYFSNARILFAGFPIIVAPSDTREKTTGPEAIVTLLPTLTRCKITAPEPIRVPSPMHVNPPNCAPGLAWQYCPTIASCLSSNIETGALSQTKGEYRIGTKLLTAITDREMTCAFQYLCRKTY